MNWIMISMSLTIFSHEKSCTFEYWNNFNVYFFDLGHLDDEGFILKAEVAPVDDPQVGDRNGTQRPQVLFSTILIFTYTKR